MHTASALLSLGLATVFLLSGVGKLRALGGAEATLAALRLPATAARSLTGALATGELLIAVALLFPPPVLVIAAVAATALSVSFLAVVIRAYVLGSREDCGCFGEGDTPISVRLILRNVALLAAAALAAVLSGSGTGGVLVAFRSSDARIAVLAAALLGIVLWLSRSAADSSTDDRTVADPLADGAHPHIVVIEHATGTPRDLSAAASGRSQLLVFVKPGCGSCIEVITELDRRGEALKPIVAPTLIVSAEAGRAPGSHEGDRFLLDPADLNARQVGVGERRPVAALLATDGKVVQPLAFGRDEIFDLLDALEQATRTQ